MAYSDVILADTPVAYWRMDNTTSNTNLGSGTSALTIANSPSTVTGPGTLGNGLTFVTASSHSGSATDENALDRTDNFSYECWVYFNTLQNQGIMSKGSGQPSLGMITTGGGHWVLQGAMPGSSGLITSTTDLATGQWYHVVWTANGSGSYKIYVNSADQSGSSTGGYFMSANSSAFRVAYPEGFASYLAGRLDEVAVYNYALTSGQVAAHYAAAFSNTVDAALTNIAVTGETTTVTATSGATVTVPDTNIAVTGQDTTVVALDNSGASVAATETNITIGGQDTTIAAEGSITVSVDETTIAVDARDATFSVVSENYDSIVSALGPVRWYKFDSDGTDEIAGQNLTGGTQNYSNLNGITGTADDTYLWHTSSGDIKTGNQQASHLGYTSAHGASIEFFMQTTELNGSLFYFYGNQAGTYAETSGGSSAFTGGYWYVTVRYLWTGTGQTVTGWGVRNGYLARVDAVEGNNVITSGSGTTTNLTASINAAKAAARAASIESQYNPVWTTSDKYVADGAWHHVVMSSIRNTDGSFTHATFVDGVQLATNLGTIAALTDYTGWFTLGTVYREFGGDGGTLTKATEFGGGIASLDELAIYDKGLTLAQALEHSSARYGTIISDPSREVVVDEANISVSGIAGQVVDIPRDISVESTNIMVREQSVIQSGDGDVLYGWDTGIINVTGQDVVVAAQRDRNVILTEPSSITVQTDILSVYTTVDDLTFEFVLADSTVLGALDAQVMTDIELGSFLFAQEKRAKIRLANTCRFNSVYRVSTFSSNTDLIPYITYSLNDQDYYNILDTPTIAPLALSDIVFIKLIIPPSLPIGDGNFLVNVEIINVDATG